MYLWLKADTLISLYNEILNRSTQSVTFRHVEECPLAQINHSCNSHTLYCPLPWDWPAIWSENMGKWPASRNELQHALVAPAPAPLEAVTP